MADSHSILATDFGSVYTRALLIDVVDGVYRLIARAEVRSTAGFPAGDVRLGLRQAVEQIGRVTGRTLMDKDGNIITPETQNQSGVDYFIATASGGRSLRAVLVGLMPGLSIESGRRAADGTYVNIVDTLSLYDERSAEEKLNAILLSQPDLIFVTGGTEGGATDPLLDVLGLVEMAINSMAPERRPRLLYAGNSNLADTVKGRFGELTRVFVADNVRPSLEEEDLDAAQLQLGLAFDDYKASQGSGFGEVGKMTALGLLPTAQSYTVITEYLGRSRQRKVDGIAAVDVGSATSVLATHSHQKTRTAIRTDLGLGLNAPGIVQNVPLDLIRRWIPFSIAEADLLNYALNKSLRPSTIPINQRELYLEYALLRATVQEMLTKQRPEWVKTPPSLELLIAAGSALAGTGNPAITAMLLLDIFQPKGLTDLLTDPNGLIPALGALAYVSPETVVQLLDGNNLERIGTVFSLEGAPALRRAAVRVRIDYENGERYDDKIDGGELTFIELPPGNKAKVRLNMLQRGVRIDGRGAITTTVNGGLAGIIIDTRGRPLSLADDLKKRSLQLILWLAMASGVVPEEIPDELLQPATERPRISAADVMGSVRRKANPAEEAPRRRGLFGFGQREAAKPQIRAKERTVDDLLAVETSDEELEQLFGDGSKPLKKK
ncbi:MAG: glutamate mutase L [Phototrophicaceae bacterium]|jgi:hypothetical protein